MLLQIFVPVSLLCVGRLPPGPFLSPSPGEVVTDLTGKIGKTKLGISN